MNDIPFEMPAFEPGSVWLVGAGPGDPGLLSVLALYALREADVVVYDALVSDAILKLAPPGARLEYAGKRGGKPSPTQADISQPAQVVSTQRVVAPGPASVEKHGATNAKQSKRIPVRKIALFHRQEYFRVAVLIAQRVSTQTGIPAELNRIVKIEIIADGDIHGCEQQPLCGPVSVVPGAEVRQRILCVATCDAATGRRG